MSIPDSKDAAFWRTPYRRKMRHYNAVCRDLRRTYRATVIRSIPDRVIRDGRYANGYTVTRQKKVTR